MEFGELRLTAPSSHQNPQWASAPVVAYLRRWSFSETSLAEPQKFSKIAAYRLRQKTDSDLALKGRGFSRAVRSPLKSWALAPGGTAFCIPRLPGVIRRTSDSGH